MDLENYMHGKEGYVAKNRKLREYEDYCRKKS